MQFFLFDPGAYAQFRPEAYWLICDIMLQKGTVLRCPATPQVTLDASTWAAGYSRNNTCVGAADTCDDADIAKYISLPVPDYYGAGLGGSPGIPNSMWPQGGFRVC